MSMNTPRRRGEGGFTLIEVLVALLILAIGLLGLAALQTQGVRFNHDAAVRSQATSLAYDIIDKMRVNRGNADLYVTGSFPAGPYNSDVCAPGDGAADLCCAATSSDSQDELYCWLAGVSNRLPLGQATIAQQAAPNDDLFDITMLWLDREPRDFAGTTRLPASDAECTARAQRAWIAPNCFVTQNWTVWP